MFWQESKKDTTWKTRRRWEDNIKMDFKEIRWELWTAFACCGVGTTVGRL
jgi:hypothetical protein